MSFFDTPIGQFTPTRPLYLRFLSLYTVRTVHMFFISPNPIFRFSKSTVHFSLSTYQEIIFCPFYTNSFFIDIHFLRFSIRSLRIMRIQSDLDYFITSSLGSGLQVQIRIQFRIRNRSIRNAVRIRSGNGWSAWGRIRSGSVTWLWQEKGQRKLLGGIEGGGWGL